MTKDTESLNKALREFVNGGEFMVLWREVMDSTEYLDPERDLAAASREVYDEVYDLVYMGQGPEPDEADRAVGLRGANELRKLLDGVQLMPLPQ